MPIELHLAGRHNVLNALCAAAAATRRRRLARRRARRPCHNAPGSWPIAVQNRAEWCLDRRRLLQRQPQLDEGRDRGAGERGRAALAGDGRHGRARRFRRREPWRDRPLRAQHRIDRLFATGKLSALAVEAFGPGGEWFADTEALARAVNAELTREVCVLVKGSRMQPPRARGRGAGRTAARMHLRNPLGTHAVLARQTTDASLLGIQRLLVPDGARHLRGDHRAGARPAARARG